MNNLIAPSNGDLIDLIAPDKIGLTADDKTKDEANPDDDTDYTCSKYYDDFITDSDNDDKSYSKSADKLLTKLSKELSKDYEDDNNYLALTSVGHMEINSSALGDGLGGFKAYLANAALIGLTSKSLARLNNDLVSGVDAANAMTQQQALQRIQTEGVGNFKFFAYTAPYVFHILLGVIYFSGVFMLLIAIMVGFDEGKKLIYNYYMGLIGFALIEVGLAVANNVVNYFASQRAVDIVAAYGKNVASIANLNQYYMELANYTGIVGFLGIAIVTLLPGFILKGQVSAAVNSIGAVQGQFKGGIDNAMHEATDQIGRQKAYEQEMEDYAKNKLSKMGLLDSVPPGMAEKDFYSQMYNSQSQHNKEWAAFENRDLMNSAAHMQKMQETQQMATAATANDYLGGNLATTRNAGITQGAIQAGTIEAQALEVNQADNLFKGTELKTAKQLESTAAYGQETTLEAARNAGKLEGIKEGSSDNATQRFMDEKKVRSLAQMGVYKQSKEAEAIEKKGFVNEDGELVEPKDKKTIKDKYKKLNENLKEAVNNDPNNKKYYEQMKKVLDEQEKAELETSVPLNNFGKGLVQASIKSLSSTQAYGEKGTLDNAKEAGQAEGIKQAGEDAGVVNAIDKDHKGKKDLFKGAEVNARIATNKMMSSGEYMDDKDEVAFMSKIKTNTKEDLLKQEKHGKELQEKYGRDLKGKYKGRNLGDRLEDIEEANLQAQAGKADAIEKNLSKNSSMYYDNTKYGEESQQQKTAAKIAAQGGIDKAVAVDVGEAVQKAEKQAGAVKGAFLAAANGDKQVAKELQQALVEGGDALSKKMKEALKSFETAAFTNSTKATAKDLKQSEFDLSDEVRQAKVDAFVKSKVGNAKVGTAEYNKRRAEAINDLKQAGLVNESGNAIKGDKGLVAWAAAAAGAMSSSERLSINGQGVNLTSSLNADGSANAVARIDNMSSYKGGNQHSTAVECYENNLINLLISPPNNLIALFIEV